MLAATSSMMIISTFWPLLIRRRNPPGHQRDEDEHTEQNLGDRAAARLSSGVRLRWHQRCPFVEAFRALARPWAFPQF
jgi:hypothetical protein